MVKQASDDSGLAAFGWTSSHQEVWDSSDWSEEPAHLVPARIVAHFGSSLKIAMPGIEMAELAGKLARPAELAPTVGDWVAVRPPGLNRAVIEVVLPRNSEIARKAPGNKTVRQVIAANVDIAFIVLAAGNDNDFQLERLRRFVYQLSIGNVQPVLVINKADQVDGAEGITGYVEALRPMHLPVLVCSAHTGDGVDGIISRIPAGRTAILLGSSGAGKSSLTNRLLGRDAQATQSVRESDSAGRHTTVHRELFMLSSGGMLIDTPGVREVQLWGTPEELSDSFDDIARVASLCTFSSCRHGDEEGCAIRQALQEGGLTKGRYASYQKMQNELAELKVKRTALTKRSNGRKRQSNRRSVAASRQAIDEVFDTEI